MYNPKRQRISNSPTDFNEPKRRQTPSKVIHIRNLSESVGELDVKRDLQRYGQINKILFMFKKRQALVEYNDIQSAIRCVNDAIRSSVKIAGTTAYINYSQYSNLVKNGDPVENDENHILLFNVTNAIYPINVDVMNTICSPFGKIQRILVYRENGVQSMVEYDSIESARKAKEALDNADIYTGCCTLKVQYAKINRLNVPQNDQDCWDYTLDQVNSGYNGGSNSYASNNANNTQIPSLMSNVNNNASSQANASDSIILMINNLCASKFNCDRLFNFLCLYGNVIGIKFLLTKEGSAICQMSCPDAILNQLPSLNNTYIFGQKLHINVSNQYVFKPVAKPASLPDGTPSYKDYSTSRNNRYQTSELAQRNKPVAPTSVLHWFNVPPGYDQNQVIDLFINAGAKPPTKIKVFQKKSEKSTTGLAEWNSISECTEALIFANNIDISHPSSKFPYTFKLCFTTTPIIEGQN